MEEVWLNGDPNRAVARSKNIVARQVDAQAHALGERAARAAQDLETTAAQLRRSETIAAAAPLAEWMARRVCTFGKYLSCGNSDRFIADAEALGRERPVTITASAAILGFALARVVKSSSLQRFERGSVYVERFANVSAFERAASIADGAGR